MGIIWRGTDLTVVALCHEPGLRENRSIRPLELGTAPSPQWSSTEEEMVMNPSLGWLMDRGRGRACMVRAWQVSDRVRRGTKRMERMGMIARWMVVEVSRDSGYSAGHS